MLLFSARVENSGPSFRLKALWGPVRASQSQKAGSVQSGWTDRFSRDDFGDKGVLMQIHAVERSACTTLAGI